MVVQRLSWKKPRQDGNAERGYTITRESGEFSLGVARLQADAGPRVADSAPTAGLFALAVITLHVFRRRMAA